MEIITSAKNQYVKLARGLAEKKHREEKGLFLTEGINLIRDLPSDAQIEFFLVSESKSDEFASFCDNSRGINSFYNNQIIASARARVYYVSDGVMNSLSDTVSPYGIAAVVRIPHKEFALPEGNAILLDGVSDPGNLGTIIRTAAATGFNDVYLCACADVYAPKAVRATLGGLFKINVYVITETQAEALIKARYGAALHMDGKNLMSEKIKMPVLLIAGNEAHGVRQSFRELAAEAYALPMKNGMESLNVAVAAAVAMYQTTE